MGLLKIGFAVSNTKTNLPKINQSALSLAAEGKLSRAAELAALIDKRSSLELASIRGIAIGIQMSPLLKHVNELADHQKKMRELIQGSFSTLPFTQISRAMSDIAKPYNDLMKMSDLGKFSEIIKGHQNIIDSFAYNKHAVLANQAMMKQIAEPLANLNTIASSFRPTAFEKMVQQLKTYDSPVLFEAIQSFSLEENFLDRAEIIFDDFNANEIRDIEEEIESVFEDPKKVYQLSRKAKQVLVFLFLHIFLPAIVSFSTNYSYDAWISSNQHQEIDVKELARHLKSELAPEFLSSYRLAKVEGLRLREEPNLNSGIIKNLSKGSLLQIIDKNHKSWLLVEVVSEEDRVVGWVSRRYTKHLH